MRVTEQDLLKLREWALRESIRSDATHEEVERAQLIGELFEEIDRLNDELTMTEAMHG